MSNDHVAEPFRSTLDSMSGGNLFELHARSERLSIDVARKQMGNDVLRCLLAARPNGAAAQVEAVIALCDAESKK